MAWERKVSRTLQLRNEQAIGQLAKILHLISDNGGNIGDIRMITETSQHVVRDITIYADSGSGLRSCLLNVIGGLHHEPL